MAKNLFNELSLSAAAAALCVGFGWSSSLRDKPVLPEGLTPVTMTEVRELDAGKPSFFTGEKVNLERIYPDGAVGLIPGAGRTFEDCVTKELKRMDHLPDPTDPYRNVLYSSCSSRDGHRVYMKPDGSLYMPFRP